MAKFKNLKVGEVLSESQFYSVEKIVGDEVQLKPESGESVVLSKSYVDSFLTSGEQVDNPETKLNKTEMAALFLSSANVALTCSFNKQVKQADVEKEIIGAYQNSTPASFEKAVKAAVKKGLNGEERIITGYHSGSQNEFGRVNFLDLKLKKEPGKAFDSRLRQVDPRELNHIILRGTKYVLK